MEEETRVSKQQKCPSCGEDRMDYLVWDEDAETVACSSCKCTYTPGQDKKAKGS